MEIKFPDSSLRSCSVSVTDIGSTETDDVDNIYSSLLLTSDVKGYIYNPAWYFKENNDSSAQALDNLLLTHGWSRYNWQKVLAGELPKKVYNDPHMLTVSGQVFDQKTNAVVSSGSLNILVELGPGKPKSYTVPVSETGNFSLDSLAFYGDTKIYFDYADKSGKDKPINIKLNENPDKLAITQKIQSVPLVLNEVERNKYLQDGLIKLEERAVVNVGEKPDTAVTLQNVVVKTQKPQPEKRPVEVLNEKYTSGVFMQQARSFIDNETTQSNDGNLDALRFILNRVSQVQYVDGVLRSKHKNTMSLSNWGLNFTKSTDAVNGLGDTLNAAQIRQRDYYSKGLRSPSENVVSGFDVALFLNEIQIDVDQLKSLSAKDIAFVKYFENFSGGGAGTVGGAIAVYTKNPDYQVKSTADYPEYSLKAPGYSITKEFFNPDYGDPTFKQPEVDNRTTLYWNSSVLTGAETKSLKFKFYNNDFSKKLKIIVEGFDADGKLVHIEKNIGN